MTAAWRAGLEDARRPTTRAQDVWDRRWRRAYAAAVRMGKTPNQAVATATERTKAGHGSRPQAAEETQG